MASGYRYSSFQHNGGLEPDSNFKLLVKDDLQDSIADMQSNLGGAQDDMASMAGTTKRDEKICLVQDSMPNFAKMDHFAQDQAADDDDEDEEDLGEKLTPEKKGPSINEQLRKLREEVAKEYEEKYRASLEEVDKYKDQLEQGLRDAEKRQQAIA